MFTCNFQIYRGTLATARVIYAENNIPINLTGWQAKAIIKNTAMNVAYSLSTYEGTIALGSAGEIQLTLDPHATELMLPGSYSWDIILKNPQGDILPPLISGIVTVLQGNTTW